MTTNSSNTSEILANLQTWHCPNLAELQFRGLHIKEGWMLDSHHWALPLTATFMFLAIVAAKLIYGDWGIVWNVGSFLVALVTLLWMWANHVVS